MKKIFLLLLLGVFIPYVGYSQCTITCLNPTVDLNGSGSVTVSRTAVASVSGNSCNLTSSVSYTFDCNDIGTESVTITATNGNNNASQSCNITIRDNTAPIVSCQNTTVFLNSSGTYTLQNSDVVASSSDNCGTVNITSLSPSSVSCSNTSSPVSVTVNYNDGNGNSGSCNSTVTVQDNISPTVNCQNITITLPSNSSSAPVSNTISGSNLVTSASDNCGTVSSVVLSQSTVDCDDSPSVQVTATVNFNNGQSGSCTQTVTVQDTETPTVVCVSAGTDVFLDANGVVLPAQIDGGSTDNCAINFTLFDVNDQALSIGCSEEGINGLFVKLRGTDPSGNFAECSTTVDVRDAISPTITCVTGPINVSLDNDGIIEIDSSTLFTSATDNCTAIISTNPTDYTCADLETGSVDVVVTVQDPAGNSNQCTVTVNVTDGGAPNALCQSDFSLPLNDITSSASITISDINAGSFDACSDVTLGINKNTFTCSDVGPNTITLTVTDASSNTATCDVIVTITETIPPIIGCVSDIQLPIGPTGTVTLTPQVVANTSTDNCTATADLTIILVEGKLTYDCNDLGFQTVSFRVQDEAGNQSVNNCVVFVEIIANDNPTAICNDFTLQLTSAGTATLDPASINGTLDDCGVATVEASQTAFTCSDIGSNSVMLTVTGAGNNPSTCTATVTVEDNIAPTAVCSDFTVALDDSGNASISTTDIDNNSSDNCGTPGLALDISSFTCNEVGNNTVTLTATDGSGNMGTCTSTVTVIDNINPTAICVGGPISLQLTAGNSSVTVDPASLDNGSTDNCSIASRVASPATLDCSNTGSNTVTLTVVDPSGNTASCTVTVNLDDTSAPTAICQDITVSLDASGMASITGSQINNGSTDNCISNVSLSAAPNTFNCTNIGDNTVTLTVTDPSENSDADNCTVTVQDGTAPTANCNASTVVVTLDASGNGSITTGEINDGSTDNCDANLDLSLSQTDFTCSNLGSNNVTLTVTDDAGLTSTCSTPVFVQDLTDPTAICQDFTIQLNAGGNAVVSATDLDNTSTDNCSVSSFEISQVFYTCDNIGSNPVDFIAFDGSGNSDTTNCNVVVEDNILPTARCVQDFRIGFTGGTANITGADIDDGSFDNCTITNISVTPSSFILADNGINSVTLTVTDQSGNEGTCTVDIFVGDVTPPNAFCKNPTVALDATGNLTLDPLLVDDQSFDLNGIDSRSVSPNTFTCSNVGVNTVTLTVMDPGGNTATCQALVTIVDNTAPSAVCQNITVQLDGSGLYTLMASEVDGGSTDNCGIATSSIDAANFDCSSIGDTTVTLTLTDVNGNVSSCTSTVTIEDDQAPVADCADITVQLDDTGNASIEGVELDEASSDNCALTYEVSQSTFDCTNVGSVTVTLTVTDEGGNSASDVCTVTVEDNVMPQAICLDPTIPLLDDGTLTITAADVDGGSNDACGVASTTIDINTFGCDETGINIVTLTVTDNNGNVNTCEANVNVVDTTIPDAVCQDITVQLDANGEVTITPDQVDNGSMDACGITLGLFPFDFTCVNVGPNKVQLSATDPSGNLGSCFAIVEVEDNILPTANCDDLTVQLDGTGKVTITPEQLDDASFDNCGIKNLIASQTTFTCEEVGDNEITLTFTDDNDNKNTCTSIVTVEDIINPDAVCRDITVELDEVTGTATIAPVLINAGSNTNCARQELSFSLDMTDFDCDNVGDNTVTMTVTDVNNNTDVCTATVTIEDNTDPDAVCQDITVQLDATGNASIVADDVDGGSFDACGFSDKSIDVDAFDCSDVGDNRVILTVTDNNGNSDNCVATVTVEDNVAPEALCNDLTIQLDVNGEGSTTVADLDGGSSDACGIESIEADKLEFACEDVGDNTVTLTVTDVNDNSSTCTSTVTVEDNIAPEALCMDITVELDALGNKTIAPADVDAGSNDACGIASLELDITEFECADVGDNTVTLTVTDVNGNSSTCTSTVTVEDNLPPMAVCMDITIELDAVGMVDITGSDIDGGSTDNCGIASLEASITEFGCEDVGDNTVTLTVTDVNSNVATCDATVTVEDNLPPVPVCNSFTLTPDEFPITITAEAIDGGSTDNCGVASISIDKTEFTCDDLGDNIITLTVTDVNGNAATCEGTLTLIEGTTLPARFTSVALPNSEGDTQYEACGSDLGAKFTLTSVKTNPFFNFPDDYGQFVYLKSEDNFEFRARVTSQDEGSVAGIMVRTNDSDVRKVAYIGFNAITNDAIVDVEYGYLPVESESIPRVGQTINSDESQYFTIIRKGLTIQLFVGSKLAYTKVFEKSDPEFLVGLYLTSRQKFGKTACFDDLSFQVLQDDNFVTLPGLDLEVETLPSTFSAYPNPTSGVVNVTMESYLGQSANLDVFDINGKLMRTIQYDEVQTSVANLDLSDLNAGVYILKVRSNGKQEQVRILLQK